MSQRHNPTDENPPLNNGGVHIPVEFTMALKKFLLDGRTGNVRINVLAGKIRGFHIEEIVSL